MSILAPFLWSLLPAQLTHVILPYLSTSLPSIFPPSPRGSPTYAHNHRIASTLLVIGYVGYSFLSDGHDDLGDWYELLRVETGTDDDSLRRAFRTLYVATLFCPLYDADVERCDRSRTHHPDRAGAENEAIFIALRKAYEGLSDPIKRYAYDRSVQSSSLRFSF